MKLLPAMACRWRLPIVFQAALLASFAGPEKCGPGYFTGIGTFYGYAGGGNCSYPVPSNPVYTAAMNLTQYDSSATCGACVEVRGERGALMVTIEDVCHECRFGDLDLSIDAFPRIGNPSEGRIPITWRIVPCPVSAPISFQFKEGSSAYWTAVQVRNSRYPIARFEISIAGTFKQVHREMYNYFLMPQGMGPGPYEFRITDMNGHVLLEKGTPFLPGTTVAGKGQFDSCGASALFGHPAQPSKGRIADSRGAILPTGKGSGSHLFQDLRGGYRSALGRFLRSPPAAVERKAVHR